MLIGELARAAGLTRETIRFYEREGILPPPGREPNGYRSYDPATVQRLSFVRSARAAGLTLREVRSILDLRDGGEVPCSHVTTLLEGRLEEVLARRRELDALASELDQLVARSERLDPVDCTGAEVCHILDTGAPTHTGPGPAGAAPRRGSTARRSAAAGGSGSQP